MIVMDPTTLALTVYRHSPGRLEFEVLDEDGQPYALTGKRMVMQWRDFEGGPLRLDLNNDSATGDRLEAVAGETGRGRLIVAQATLDDLPWPLVGRANPALPLVYDFLLGPAGSESWMFGAPVYLRTGVSRDV